MTKKPLVKLMKRVANKVVNAGLETKFVSNEVNQQSFNSTISSASECYSCYPKLGAGPNTYQRVGWNIAPVSVKNSWVISLNQVSRSVNVIVDLYILIDKNNRYFPNIAGGSPPQFLRTGNASGAGSTQSFNGLNTDSFKPINTQRYTLLKHFRFQLASNVGQANGDTTTGNAPNVATQSCRTLHYTVDTPKQLKYQPTSDPDPSIPTYPNGHAPFWVLGYSKADGGPPDVGFQSITVSHSTRMLFKDA